MTFRRFSAENVCSDALYTLFQLHNAPTAASENRLFPMIEIVGIFEESICSGAFYIAHIA